MLGLHQQHEPAVALGDDQVLEVLRGVLAAQVRLERLAQLRAMTAQAVADGRQRGAGLVLDVARRRDGAPDGGDFRLERRRAAGQSLEAGQVARRPADCRGAFLDRFQVVRQRQQPQRLERTPGDIQQLQQRLEVLRRAQRKHRVARQVADRLRRGRQRLAHDSRLGGRRQGIEARPSGRRQREAAHGSDNTIEFEGLQAASGHVGSESAVESGGNRLL